MIKSYNIRILSQGFYSKNASHITIKCNENIIEEIRNGSLYLESSNINYGIRYVYSNGKTYTPKIIQGRYFTDEDYINDQKLAVIGKNLTTYCTEDNNTKNLYIDHEGDQYKVIGIIANDIVSEIDNTCFLTLNKNTPLANEVLVVDSNNKKNIDKIITNITNKVGNTNISILNIPVKGIESWMNTELNSIGFFLAILVLFALNSIAVTYYWVQNRMQHIAIMRMCGYGNFRIVSFIALRYLKCLLSGFFIGLLIITPYLILKEAHCKMNLQ